MTYKKQPGEKLMRKIKYAAVVAAFASAVILPASGANAYIRQAENSDVLTPYTDSHTASVSDQTHCWLGDQTAGVEQGGYALGSSEIRYYLTYQSQSEGYTKRVLVGPNEVVKIDPIGGVRLEAYLSETNAQFSKRCLDDVSNRLDDSSDARPTHGYQRNYASRPGGIEWCQQLFETFPEHRWVIDYGGDNIPAGSEVVIRRSINNGPNYWRGRQTTQLNWFEDTERPGQLEDIQYTVELKRAAQIHDTPIECFGDGQERD